MAPAEDGTVSLHGVSSVRTAADAILSISKGDYPVPPSGFRASDDVAAMFNRWERYRRGKELLSNTGYFCFTVLKRSVLDMAGKHKVLEVVSERYCIDKDVLRRLSELCSTKGDDKTARKALKKGSSSYTQDEVRWIEAVVKAVIRRAGEWAHDPNQRLPQITMDQFP